MKEEIVKSALIAALEKHLTGNKENPEQVARLLAAAQAFAAPVPRFEKFQLVKWKSDLCDRNLEGKTMVVLEHLEEPMENTYESPSAYRASRDDLLIGVLKGEGAGEYMAHFYIDARRVEPVDFELPSGASVQ